MAISVFEHINRLWGEFSGDALSAIACSCKLGSGRKLCCYKPGSDITTYMTLHSILEDGFVYGCFLRDKDVIIRRGEIDRIFRQISDGLSVIPCLRPDYGEHVPDLDGFAEPSRGVGELSDGLMDVMSKVWDGTSSMDSVVDRVATLKKAFFSLFNLAFITGFSLDEFFAFHNGYFLEWECLYQAMVNKKNKTKRAS